MPAVLANVCSVCIYTHALHTYAYTQMATLKRELQLLLPSIKVFLDGTHRGSNHPLTLGQSHIASATYTIAVIALVQLTISRT